MQSSLKQKIFNAFFGMKIYYFKFFNQFFNQNFLLQRTTLKIFN